MVTSWSLPFGELLSLDRVARFERVDSLFPRIGLGACGEIPLSGVACPQGR